MNLEQLGPYRIVGELGRGGMGAVYEGVSVETGEPAAIKLLPFGLARDEAFRERFQGEIETLKKLHHPNIIRLYGFGEQEGQLFYSMELVDGSSLEEELANGRRFNWREVTQYGIEVCLALRHAHDRGIVHRDLKPGNLMLTKEGSIKLGDFGIARLFGNSRMTQAGSVLGTAEYMSPEQAEGRPVDPRSDLYSFGAVLFALLARRPLFRARSLPEMLHKQRYEKPDRVRKYDPDCPEELERIIAQLLEKEPERRIPNAMLLGRRLTAMKDAFSQMSEVEEPAATMLDDSGTDDATSATAGGVGWDDDDVVGMPRRKTSSTPGATTGHRPERDAGDDLPLAETAMATLPPAAGRKAPETPPSPSLAVSAAPSADESEEYGISASPYSPPASPAAAGNATSETSVLPPRPRHRDAADGGQSAASPGELPETLPTAAFQLSAGSDAPPAEPRPPRTPPKDSAPAPTPTRSTEKTVGTFVAVDRSQLDPRLRESQDETHPLGSIWTYVMLGLLVVVAAVLWYVLRPPTADSLYARIQAHREDGVSGLIAVEGEIQDFLNRYSDDTRAKTLREYQDEIAISRKDRELERRSRFSATQDDLLPIEQAYLDAVETLQRNPQLGAAKLRALIDLYQQGKETTGPTGMCVELARRRLQQWRQREAAAAPTLIGNLEQRLQAADALPSNSPDRAAMYRAAIVLYENEVWAEPLVERARTSLKALDAALERADPAAAATPER